MKTHQLIFKNPTYRYRQEGWVTLERPSGTFVTIITKNTALSRRILFISFCLVFRGLTQSTGAETDCDICYNYNYRRIKYDVSTDGSVVFFFGFGCDKCQNWSLEDHTSRYQTKKVQREEKSAVH